MNKKIINYPPHLSKRSSFLGVTIFWVSRFLVISFSCSNRGRVSIQGVKSLKSRINNEIPLKWFNSMDTNSKSWSYGCISWRFVPQLIKNSIFCFLNQRVLLLIHNPWFGFCYQVSEQLHLDIKVCLLFHWMHTESFDWFLSGLEWIIYLDFCC